MGQEFIDYESEPWNFLEFRNSKLFFHLMIFNKKKRYRNDKFADVLLFPSQMDGGYGIPAHKIILSSCSHVRIKSIQLHILLSVSFKKTQQ